MSQQTLETALDNDSSVNRQEILDIANLARLGIDADTATSYADDISKVLALMQMLKSVDTTDVLPLPNIHEVCQDLRPDIAKKDIDRERNQSVAPAIEKGLYLVPQVIE